jgi:hypothetical protein
MRDQQGVTFRQIREAMGDDADEWVLDFATELEADWSIWPMALMSPSAEDDTFRILEFDPHGDRETAFSVTTVPGEGGAHTTVEVAYTEKDEIPNG